MYGVKLFSVNKVGNDIKIVVFFLIQVAILILLSFGFKINDQVFQFLRSNILVPNDLEKTSEQSH